MKKAISFLFVLMTSAICIVVAENIPSLDGMGNRANIDWTPVLAWLLGGVSVLASVLFGVEKTANRQLAKVINNSVPNNNDFLELAKSGGWKLAAKIIQKIT